jgi:hypothetical protein
VKGPQAWILTAALGCFAAGMIVGLVAPGVVEALTGPDSAPDPDTAYVRKLAADFGLTGAQERSLAMVVGCRREAELDVVRKAASADQLPQPLKTQLQTVRRQATERIRHVLTPEQCARFDRAARAEADEPAKK